MSDTKTYDHVFIGNTPAARKGTLCRRLEQGFAGYYSSVLVVFEDGAQLAVNRNAIRLRKSVAPAFHKVESGDTTT